MAREMLVVYFMCALKCVVQETFARRNLQLLSSQAVLGVRTGKLSFWPTNCTLLVSSAQYFLCFAGNDIFQWILQRLQITNEGG